MSATAQYAATQRLAALPAVPVEGDELDAYGVLSTIARGGMSTVYLGEHRATGERVAIKALDAYYVGQREMVERLLGEHAIARRVRHPGLVEIRCAARTRQGVPYLVMEYVRGESLGALAGRGCLTPLGLLAIAAQIARATAALHAAGVIHCDLKPDNVLVREDGAGEPLQIKVIDFGVARVIDEPPPTDGTVVGTPAFMPPEQWHGAPVARSDVYALGCLLYELITGGPVFPGALPQMMIGHCERAPEPPSQRGCRLPAPLERVLLRALAKDPELRPTMTELALELAALSPSTDLPDAPVWWPSAVDAPILTLKAAG
ncbi:MAG TPA: serine/threonine-protein kinase [Kofleriaceae bacterium]|nr:serine/threonine-protein kinase [Kofleriaceae bacterium]